MALLGGGSVHRRVSVTVARRENDGTTTADHHADPDADRGGWPGGRLRDDSG